ncbi:MAG TPA: nuclear transport factor 2 family protein [Bacteroidia bacterium]|jgi:hypothetical protein|nr:nuclear transport factor 2 family protein [Bacteroidia bacterium]
MKKTLLSILFFIWSLLIHAQLPETDTLFKKLKSLDSLLFEVGFNQCNIEAFETLVSNNSFEFYHDKGGPFLSKDAFIKSLKEGLCQASSPYKHRRELLKNTMEVYRLEKNGVLYGAVQIGLHRFFERKNNEPEYAGSTAKFTHLWLLENGEWKLSRILSYDHQMKEEEKKK